MNCATAMILRAVARKAERRARRSRPSIEERYGRARPMSRASGPEDALSRRLLLPDDLRRCARCRGGRRYDFFDRYQKKGRRTGGFDSMR